MNRFVRDLRKIGEFFSHLRTVGIIVISVFLIIAISRNGCTRAEIAHLLETTTGLNYQNDILHNHVAERDSVIHEKQHDIENLQNAIDRSEGRVNMLVDRYTALYGRFEAIADSVDEIPPDTSYNYLNAVAYPDGGPKEYPFSEWQISGMHRTFLEHQSYARLNTELDNRVIELNTLLTLRESETIKGREIINEMKTTRTDLEQVIDNKSLIIEAQDQHISKTRRNGRIWGVVGGVVVVGLAATVIAMN